MKSKKARTIFEFLLIFLIPVLFIIVCASSYSAPDINPIITFTSNTQDADTSAVLTAVAVDTLTNAGISIIEIYQDGNLLEKKICDGLKTCTFSKTVIETNTISHNYYAKTTDLGGNTVQSSTITINFKGITKTVNLPPSLEKIGGKSLYANQLLEFTILGRDPNGDTLTYSASNLPSGASFNPTTRTFSWTPSYSQIGIYTVTFKVSDGVYDYSETIIISVASANRPPTLNTIGNKNVNENELLEFTISATDEDGDTLTYSASNLPPGASFNPTTRKFSWTPSSSQTGTYQVTFTVSDGKYEDSETITIFVGKVNHAPILNPIGNKNVNETQLLQFTISAADEDNDTLTYSASNLPPGASFNPSTRTFSWTPNSTQSGNYQVTFNVSDGFLSDSETITITVIDIGKVNHAPILNPIGNKNVNKNELLQFTISATDEDNDTLTYSTSTLPSGASFNSTTRTFSWIPSQSGTYQITFNVSDGFLSDSETIIIFVGVNSPPIFNGSIVNIRVANAAPNAYTWSNAIGGLFSQLTIVRNRNLTFIPSIYDPDNDTLIYNWYVNSQPFGNSLNLTRAFTTAGLYNVTLVVSDSKSSVSATWMINVENETVYGTITDMDTGAVLGGLNISFYPADIFNPETNSTEATGYENLVPKAIPDTQTDAIGGFFFNLANGRYHIVIQGSKEIDFDIHVNNSKGKEKHDSEVSKKVDPSHFNAEGHIVHSGKYSDSNNYTCGNLVYFTMFGVNNGQTNETITFSIQDHSSIGGPNAPIVYYGSLNNPNESLTIPAGQKLNKMFKFKIPCSLNAGRHDIHVLWNNETWHKIGNFFVVPDTTAPYVFGWKSLTTYTNSSTRIPYDGENVPQPGTIGYNEMQFYYMMEGFNEPKWGVKVCADKDIATDEDNDGIADNDEDTCMINPPRFVGLEDIPPVNYTKSGYYRAKITATDDAGNTNSTYTNVTVLASEEEVDGIATAIYGMFVPGWLPLHKNRTLSWTWFSPVGYGAPDAWDRTTIDDSCGDEYMTPWDGLNGTGGVNWTQIGALEYQIVMHVFPSAKAIFSMTGEEYNYTLSSFLLTLNCVYNNYGPDVTCDYRQFAPEIYTCTPNSVSSPYYSIMPCYPQARSINTTTSQVYTIAVRDPNNDLYKIHWYVDGIEILNTEDHNQHYISGSKNETLVFISNSTLIGNHKIKTAAWDASGMNISIVNGPHNSYEWDLTVVTA